MPHYEPWYKHPTHGYNDDNWHIGFYINESIGMSLIENTCLRILSMEPKKKFITCITYSFYLPILYAYIFLKRTQNSHPLQEVFGVPNQLNYSTRLFFLIDSFSSLFLSINLLNSLTYILHLCFIIDMFLIQEPYNWILFGKCSF